MPPLQQVSRDRPSRRAINRDLPPLESPRAARRKPERKPVGGVRAKRAPATPRPAVSAARAPQKPPSPQGKKSPTKARPNAWKLPPAGAVSAAPKLSAPEEGKLPALEGSKRASSAARRGRPGGELPPRTPGPAQGGARRGPAPLPSQAAAIPPPASQQLPAPGAGTLSWYRDWLRTEAGWIVRSTGRVFLPRGINVIARELATDAIPSWRSGLGLDDIALGALSEGWHINLLRLTLDPAAVLANDSLQLASLDDLISAAAYVGMHTLLALDVPAPPPVSEIASSEMAGALMLLAARYQAEPAVLFELCQPDASYGRDWPLAASVVIGLTRRQHGASLLFVGGVERPDLRPSFPLRVMPDTPIAHVVYTLAIGGNGSTLGAYSELRPFLQVWPTFASKWAPGGAGLSPLADIEALQLEQTGTGFAAWNWNAEPRLVADAGRGNLAPTGSGMMVQRALSRPTLDTVATFNRR